MTSYAPVYFILLILESNELTGTVPSQLASLTLLKKLDLCKCCGGGGLSSRIQILHSLF